jgi:membrane protease YdiL (CAAX protease family)
VFTLAHVWEGFDDPRVIVALIAAILPTAFVAGALAIRTGRLGAGIVVHVLTNLSATLLGLSQLHS